ncbi:4'-phosphopantetheinyl transferase superfamily protein [Mycoplasma iguanae]|uniref:4'-phosphopantetheinyl transferase superfamily protein n=1 Tax=Mycoplasma iguanae TaxID=292461 RepID=A0ABY5RBC6_9MOLU|nr:4'-phosphopantetheinyl transferase superfamily protein [Mycoplasma iguanae]UVD81520.1 4'-phosphopantetheinyl transferase superfamily protein [Mycoplasma iguanae]
MIGIDITRISRFQNKSENFAKRILSHNEFLEYKKIDDKAYFLALRWAIKEALFKADNTLLSFQKINISKINKKYFYKNFQITTSKEDDYLIACVVKTI